jgi:uncharacterized protein with PIN domain
VSAVPSRLEAGYREKLRLLLMRLRPRRLDFGVSLLLGRARDLAERAELPRAEALARVYEFTRWRVQRALSARGLPAGLLPDRPPDPLFLCDASLGGLARWLRAAGQRAELARCSGDRLVAEARRRRALLLSTDARLWERRSIRTGAVPALWVPSGMPHWRQLGVVLRDLGLEPAAPRCMECGGALRAVAKPEVADRIPPRTARWKDEYFVCSVCDRLLWRGTHWERIASRLSGLAAAATLPARP